MTAHYILPPQPVAPAARERPPRLRRHGRGRSPTPSTAPRGCATEVGLDPGRVRVIPHGAFDYLTAAPRRGAAAARARGSRGPGDPLLRPAPPLQGDRHAAARLPPASRAPSSGSSATRAWSSSRCAASPREAPGRVRFLTRFVEDAEIPAIFRRADVVVLPYRDAEHSGVLYTGLAFGKPMVLSAVGGFPEVAEEGARPRRPARGPRRARRRARGAGRRRGAPAPSSAPPPAPRRRAATPGTRSPPRPSPSTRSCWSRGR